MGYVVSVVLYRMDYSVKLYSAWELRLGFRIILEFSTRYWN